MLRARALLDKIRRYWVLAFATASLPLAALYLDDLYLQASGRLQVDATWLLPTAITQFGVWTFLALGWRETVTCSAHVRIRVRDAFAHLGLFTIGKYLPGKVWGALARGTRLGQAGSTLGGAAQATLIEQVLVFHSAAALCALIGAWIFNDAWRAPLTAAALILLLAGSSIGRIGVSTSRALLVLLRPELETASTPAISAPAYVRLFAIYFFAWLLHGLVLFCVAAAFLGHEPEARLVASMVFANAAAMLVGFAAVFAPAGIGVRDATLASLLAVSMPIADAALLAIVARMFSVAADLVAGTLAMLPADTGRSKDSSPDA